MANEPQQRIAPDDPEALEKIVEQFTRRIRSGEHPSIVEYQAAYPDYKDEIEDLLASVAMIEKLKSDPTQPATSRRSLDEVSDLERVGSYKILGEIGRGGMGVVFEGVHESLGRRVAIKVMPTPLVNSEKFVDRFKREAKAAARLHHTNIVGVFGVGEGDGFHYYVMDFVDGQSLSEVISGLNQVRQAAHSTQINLETRQDDLAAEASTGADELTIPDTVPGETPHLPPRRSAAPHTDAVFQPSDAKHFRWAARIGANIADALAYAHAAHILHRDIKPANIMLDRKGVVWITDFGLAKDSSNEINLTKTGDVIGTPQYLAPESLQGNYDQQSEVYCLGLTLYELANLQPAYRSGTTAEVLGAIASSSPPPLRKLNPNIPIDLSTIIDKAVSRDPAARYPSAQAMRQDLLAFVEDRPISARPPSTVENVLRWSRRNPLAASLSAISCLLLVLVAVSATIGYLYTTDALAKEAYKSTKLAEQQRKTELQRLAAVEAQGNAENFAKKMKAQYDRAEGNIAITLEAFDEMFKQVVSRGSASTDIDLDGFEELAGIDTSITPKDAAFLDKLLVFYDQFAKQNADNDSLRKESAKAFRRVANIYQLIGESKRAIAAYESAIKAYELILQQSPDSKNDLISLASTKCELSILHRRNERLREAVDLNDEAITLLEDVPVEQLDDELKLALAKTLNSLGSSSTLIAAIKKDRPGLLEQFFRDRSQRISARPAPGFNRQPSGGRDRRPRPERPGGQASERRGPEHRGPGSMGRPPNGRNPNGRNPNARRGGRDSSRMLDWLSSGYSTRAIEILDELIAANPDEASYRSVRANCYCSLAAAELKPNPGKAREMRDRAIKELEALIEMDSENPEYQYRLALAYSLGGNSSPEQNDTELLKQAVKIAEELRTQYPQFLDYYYLDCSVRIKYADQLIRTDQLPAAFETLEAAKLSLDKIIELSTPNRTLKTTSALWAEQLTRLASAAEQAGNSKLVRDARNLRNQVRLSNPHRNRGGPPSAGFDRR